MNPISFQDLESISPEVKKALKIMKFEEPTSIQSEVIPAFFEENDLIVCAETGSGKTGAFGIPLLPKLQNNKEENALILAPTRELATQIFDFFFKLTSQTKYLRVTKITGGADLQKQTRELSKKPRIVIATPGRLNDHLKRKTIDLSKFSTLILDEGDRMLDMGFAPQIDQILKFMPEKRQTLLFTATLSEQIKKLTKKYLKDAKQIGSAASSLPVASIKQARVEIPKNLKNDTLLDEINKRDGSIIVFINTKRKTEQVASQLLAYGLKVDLIHGDRSQGQRNRAIENFRLEKSKVLCATDVAARGIDIPHVSHVINYDLPEQEEDYVHRIGRTARNGASGEALSFVSPEDRNEWNKLVKKYQISGLEVEGKSEKKKKKNRIPRKHKKKPRFNSQSARK